MITKTYLLRLLACAFVVSCFSMCTKSVNEIEGQASETPAADPQLISAATNVSLLDTSQPYTGCTYTVKTSEWFVDGAKIPPGSVVCIPAGARGALLLKNFKGTAEKPIIITNKGGKVTFNAMVAATYAFKTQNCQNIKIVGNGDKATKYGFCVNGANLGMTLEMLTSDFEVAYVEVRNSKFAGIMAKTDPSCDAATRRGNFTMRNVSIHDNYIHNVGGEGIYLGNSFYAKGRILACGTILPHDVVNSKVYNNTTESTGCEGIQVGCATSGAEIYNNTVKRPGLDPFMSGQTNGIQIGEGTGGKCYNNLVKDAPGNGIIILGYGDNKVFNNYIINSGTFGIFADSRYTPGPNFQIINNTIIYPKQDGVKLNSETIPMNTVINNVMVISGTGVAVRRKSTRVRLTEANNYVVKNVTECGFVNYSAEDFHLLKTSPLISKGANALSYGVSIDFYGLSRNSPGGFEVGATAY
jgi:hypothetical protein